MAKLTKAERARVPQSRLGVPSKKATQSGSYPMPDKKHARIAKALAAMHHSPHQAEIDRKANAILHKDGSGTLGGMHHHAHLHIHHQTHHHHHGG